MFLNFHFNRGYLEMKHRPIDVQSYDELDREFKYEWQLHK